MAVLEAVINSKSKTFFAFCFCFILGVGVFSFSNFDTPPSGGGAGGGASGLSFFIYLLAFIILAFAVFFWSKKRLRILLFCFLFFLAGGLRFTLAVPSPSPGHITYYTGNNFNFEGLIVGEPDVRISDSRYALEAASCVDKEVCPRKIRGKILAVLPSYPAYKFGDILEINCFLSDPAVPLGSDFDYKKYLAKDGVWAVCKNPKVISARSSVDVSLPAVSKIKIAVFGKIFYLKSKLQNKINSLWPEPESSFMAGLLYGSKSGLPVDLAENFSRTGITHIIAVSGYNVSIFAVYLMSALIYFLFPRTKAFWAATLLIIGFIFFTGASASVVRAGIMGITALIAGRVGRVTRPHNILVFAAGLMVLANPYVLVWDVGFQLSFLATLGLVYLSPILQKKLSRARLPEPVRAGASDTLAAIIFTLPFMLFQFGRLSIAAPLVNMLILGIIPLLMFFGFFSIILGFLFYPLGQTLAWITAIGLKYVIIISEFFGTRSWSAVNWQIPFWLMAGMYALLIVVIMRKNQN